jgi:hypothetical protein
MQRINKYDTWADCMRAGYKDSLKIMQQLGDVTLNSTQTYVKFVCSANPILKIPPLMPNGTNGPKGDPV